MPSDLVAARRSRHRETGCGSDAAGSLEPLSGVVEVAGGGALGGVAPAAGSNVEVLVVALQRGEASAGVGSANLEQWPGQGRRLGLRARWRGSAGFGLVADAGGRVGDPALLVLDAPVDAEVVDRLSEVLGGGVDGRVVAGAAEGDVGELSAAPGGEDVGALEGGALGSVDREGIAVVEVVAVDAAR